MKKHKKLTTIKQDVAKLLLDLGKLLFGGIFIGGVLRGDFSQHFLIIGGFAVGITFCIIGLFLGVREEKIGDDN